jgi:hypothetical protein
MGPAVRPVFTVLVLAGIVACASTNGDGTNGAPSVRVDAAAASVLDATSSPQTDGSALRAESGYPFPEAAPVFEDRGPAPPVSQAPENYIWTDDLIVVWLDSVGDVVYWAVTEPVYCLSGGSCLSVAGHMTHYVLRLDPLASEPASTTLEGPLNTGNVATSHWSFHLLRDVQLVVPTLTGIDWESGLPAIQSQWPSFFTADEDALYLGRAVCPEGSLLPGFCETPTSFVLTVESLTLRGLSDAAPSADFPIDGADRTTFGGQAAVLGEHIYFGQYDLQRVSKTGGSLATLRTLDGFLLDLVAGEDRLYGVVQGASEQLVVALASDGSTSEVVATSSGTIKSLEVDGGDVYWIDSPDIGTGGTLRRTRTSGQTETLLDGAPIAEATIARGQIYYAIVVHEPLPDPNPYGMRTPTAFLSVAPLP